MSYFARIYENKIVNVFKEQKAGTIPISEEVYNLWKEHPNWIFIDNQLIEPTKPQPTLNELKQIKMLEIKQAFINEMKAGVIDFTIPSSNITVQVDARRSNINNDLQNVEGLINLLQDNTIQEPVLYKCYDNNKYPMTLNDLIALKKVLIEFGLQLYQKKHYLEDLIQNAQTKEELEQIKW